MQERSEGQSLQCRSLSRSSSMSWGSRGGGKASRPARIPTAKKARHGAGGVSKRPALPLPATAEGFALRPSAAPHSGNFCCRGGAGSPQPRTSLRAGPTCPTCRSMTPARPPRWPAPAMLPARGEEEGEAALTCSRCSSRKPLLTELHLPAAGEGGKGGESTQPLPSPPAAAFRHRCAPARAARRSGRLSPALQTAPGDGKRDPPPAAASFPWSQRPQGPPLGCSQRPGEPRSALRPPPRQRALLRRARRQRRGAVSVVPRMPFSQARPQSPQPEKGMGEVGGSARPDKRGRSRPCNTSAPPPQGGLRGAGDGKSSFSVSVLALEMTVPSFAHCKEGMLF